MLRNQVLFLSWKIWIINAGNDYHKLKFVGGTKCLKKVLPATKANEKFMRDFLDKDKRLSVRMITDIVRIDKMILQQILGEALGLGGSAPNLSKLVLTDEQEQTREVISKDLLGYIEEVP